MLENIPREQHTEKIIIKNETGMSILVQLREIASISLGSQEENRKIHRKCI